MALRIGNLYVSLTAQTDGFSKSMSAALKDVERFSREVKKAANDAAQIAGSITAMGGALLKLGADASGPAKAALDEFSRSAKQAAAPVAEALVPVVREASALLRGLGKAFSDLDPHTKATVARVFEVAAAVTGVSLVLGRLASTAQLVAGVLSGTFSAIAAVGVGPLLAIVAGVGLTVGALTLLHRAWRLNWGGIQETVAGVVAGIREMFSGLAESIGKVFDFLMGTVETFVSAQLDAVDLLQKTFGVKLFDVAGLRAGFGGLFKDLKSGAFFNEALTFGKSVGSAMGGALLDEWKTIGKQLGLDEMMNKVRSISNGAPLRGAGAHQPIVSGAVNEQRLRALGGSAIDMSDAAVRKMAGPVAKGPNRIGRTSSVGGETARRNFEQFSKEQTEKAKEAAEEAAAGTRSSLLGTVQGMVGKLGALGGIINNTVNAAMTGGPWAALAAGLGGLLTETKAFASLMEQAAGGLKELMTALQPSADVLLNAVGNVLAPVLQVVAAALTAIAPLFDVVAQVLNAITPFLVLLIPVVQALAPLFEIAAGILGSIVKALEPVLRVLFDVAKIIFTVIFGIVRAVVTVWNAILEALATVVDVVVGIFTLGIEQRGGDFIRKGKGSTATLDAALGAMSSMSYDAAQAAATKAAADQRAAGAAEATADTMNKLNESLLNVPTGFKVAASRFNADAGLAMSGGGDGSGGTTNIGTVNIYSNHAEELVDDLMGAIARREYLQTGTVYSGHSKGRR